MSNTPKKLTIKSVKSPVKKRQVRRRDSNIWEVAERLFRNKKNGFDALISRTYKGTTCRDMKLYRVADKWVRIQACYERENETNNENDYREQVEVEVQNDKEMKKYLSHMNRLISGTVRFLDL